MQKETDWSSGECEVIELQKEKKKESLQSPTLSFVLKIPSHWTSEPLLLAPPCSLPTQSVYAAYLSHKADNLKTGTYSP